MYTGMTIASLRIKHKEILIPIYAKERVPIKFRGARIHCHMKPEISNLGIYCILSFS